MIAAEQQNHDLGLARHAFYELPMATVFIPAQLRSLASGQDQVDVPGTTVGEVIDALDQRFDGIRERLCDGDQLRPSLQIAVDNVISTRGLLTEVAAGSEVHFLPAIGGG